MYSVLLNTSVVLMFLWLMLYFRNLGQRFTKRRNFFVPMVDVFMYSLPIFIDNNNTLGLKDSDVSEYNKTVKIQIIHFILAPFIISFMLIVMHYEPTIDYQVEQYGVIGYGTVISTDNNLVFFEIIINDKKYALSCKKCYGKVGEEIIIKFLPEDPKRFIPNYKPQR